MYISPTLLLLLVVIFVFAPSIQEWITLGGTTWYRPYLVWLGTIAFVYWSQRRAERKKQLELAKSGSANGL